MKPLISIFLLLPFLVFSQHQEERSYVYDNLNRLVEVVFDNGISMSYEYDALGNRTRRSLGVQLSRDNYSIESRGLSCMDSNDGSIRIEVVKRNSYDISIRGTNSNFYESFLLEDKNNWVLDIANLKADEYNIDIGVAGISSDIYQETFKVRLAEPEPIEATATLLNGDGLINLEMIAGTAPFTILINDNKIGETDDSTYSLHVQHGDVLQVSTAISCEGIFSETIYIFDDVILYPNPVEGTLNITLPLEYSTLKNRVEIYSSVGFLLLSKEFPQDTNTISIDVQSLPPGLYIYSVISNKEETLWSGKFIKK